MSEGPQQQNPKTEDFQTEPAPSGFNGQIQSEGKMESIINKPEVSESFIKTQKVEDKAPNQPYGSIGAEQIKKEDQESPKYTKNERNISSSEPSESHSDRSRSQSHSLERSQNIDSHSLHGQDELQEQEAEQTLQDQKIPEKSNKPIRYKYCCKKCKHADRDKVKKTCVCVVPKDQRRTAIGDNGCQTCGCHGCSKEDYISRGEDPEYHPEENKKNNQNLKSRKEATESFEARNGCCKNCMKAFSKTGRSCICQVPEDVRKTKLSDKGCKICGCRGCNPEDKKEQEQRRKGEGQQRRKRSRSHSHERRKRERRSRSRDNRRRSVSKSPEIIDTYAMNFQNIDRSILSSMITNEYEIDTSLLGFGIPQRSYSYIYGKAEPER